MLFNSLAFAIFLPLVFTAYWALEDKYRKYLLLVASYYFYMSWNVKYVVLILFTTIVSFYCARWIEVRRQFSKLCLIMASVACLSVLFIFKYFNFFFDSLERFCRHFALPFHSVTLNLLLPVGISFYTFQTLSYVYDVYKGKVKAENNILVYAAFISFFPQLVAGPIERTENLLPQIRAKHVFSSQEAVYGLKLMAWGFFKKLVIADNVSIYVNQIFDDVHYYQGFSMFLAAFFFTLQIYCDFSGYSDIAIGCAKLFNISLMKNFDSPYFSASVSEFWSRWHISLSSWFRDYVYIPLGGNRKGKIRQYINLMITMLVSGLWHGSAFTYVIWGGIHGMLEVLEKILWPSGKNKKQKKVQEVQETQEIGQADIAQIKQSTWRTDIAKIKQSTWRTDIAKIKQSTGQMQGAEVWPRRLLTFLLVMMAWVFFRATGVRDALYVLRHMWDGIGHPAAYIRKGLMDLGIGKREGFWLLVPIFILTAFDYVSLKKDPLREIERIKPVWRWVIYYSFMMLVLLLASFNAQEFVYFQF